MVTISEIIPNLENGKSGSKGVFDKISEQTSFALSPREYKRTIQPGDFQHFLDEHGIRAI